MSGDAVPRAWLHVRVEGRVQRVGFRWFVQQRARALGLSGWVRNHADGSVEVSAVGDAGAVARLREQLEVGPPHARVDRVTAVTGGRAPRGATFEIVDDGDADPE